MKQDYCFACHESLFKIIIGDLPGLKLDHVMVCINEKCSRVGLLAVAGLRYDLKKEVKKNATSDGSHKPHRKKS